MGWVIGGGMGYHFATRKKKKKNLKRAPTTELPGFVEGSFRSSFGRKGTKVAPIKLTNVMNVTNATTNINVVNAVSNSNAVSSSINVANTTNTNKNIMAQDLLSSGGPETNITSANNSIVAQDLLSGGPETKMLLLEDEVRKLSVAMQAEVSSSRGSQSAEERCLLMSNTLQSLTISIKNATSNIVNTTTNTNTDKVVLDLEFDGFEKQMQLLEEKIQDLATAMTTALSAEERCLLLMHKSQKLTADLEHATRANKVTLCPCLAPVM
jgi:hypothetical protein